MAEDPGDDMLYSSTAIDSHRTDLGVFLTVRNNKTNKITLIIAHRLLVAIEPTEENIKPLDLSPFKQETLSKFTYSNEFTGLVDNAVFNSSFTDSNLPSAAAPDNTLVFQNEPMVPSFEYTGVEHLFRVMIIGNTPSTAEEARALAQNSFNTLLRSGQLSQSADKELSWAAFSVHGAMHARVTVGQVRSGFFQDLHRLQRSRSTWWTGGAFSANLQTQLGEFDEDLIPKILADL